MSSTKADHALDIINRLYEMRMEERHCDFVIKVGSEIIPAHRSVLTAMSDYFDRMLFHDTIENSSGMVYMKNVDPDCVRICVDFIYGREVEVSEEKYEDLMHVANLMQLNKLAKIVENVIGQNLNVKVCYTAKRVADMYSYEVLQNKCIAFATENFLSISMEDEFGDLDKRYAIEIIKSKNVSMTETEKLEVALRWVKHDVGSRSDDFIHFMKYVDLRFVPIEKRQQLVHSEPLINKDNGTRVRIFTRSIINSLKSNIEKVKLNSIVVFDTFYGDLYQFQPKSYSWRQMYPRNDNVMKFRNFSVNACSRYIYVFIENRQVFRLKYNTKTPTWERMADMKEEHGSHPPVVVVGKLFYAIGGYDSCHTKCVERFDPRFNEWTKLHDKPNDTSSPALLAMRGCIYTFSGMEKDSGFAFVNDVLRWDRTTSEWKEMRPMRRAIEEVVAVELNEKAYVICGSYLTDPGFVGCYDPEMDQWTTLAPMIPPCRWFRAFAIDGSIYAVAGGYSERMEKYDVNTNEWTIAWMPSGIYIRDSVAIKC